MTLEMVYAILGFNANRVGVCHVCGDPTRYVHGRFGYKVCKSHVKMPPISIWLHGSPGVNSSNT